MNRTSLRDLIRSTWQCKVIVKLDEKGNGMNRRYRRIAKAVARKQNVKKP